MGSFSNYSFIFFLVGGQLVALVMAVGLGTSLGTSEPFVICLLFFFYDMYSYQKCQSFNIYALEKVRAVELLIGITGNESESFI